MIRSIPVAARERACPEPRLGRVILLVVAWSGALAGIGVYRVWALQSNAADLGFLVHGLATAVRDGWQAPIPWAGWSLIQDHFSPLLLLVAPFSVNRFAGYLLVVVQACALGVTAWQVWLITTEFLARRGHQFLILGSFLVSPPLLFGALYDVHANVLAAPFLALLLRGILTSQPWFVYLGGIGASLLREDAAFLVLAVSLAYIYPLGRRRALLLGGLAGIALVAWQLTAGGPQVVRDWSFDHLVFSRPDAFVGSAFSGLWGNGGLAAVLVGIAIPWVAFVKPSRRSLVAVGLGLLPLLFSGMEATKSVGFQYYALVPVVIAVGAIETLRTARLSRFRSEVGWAFAGVSLLLGPFATGAIAPLGVNVWEVLSRGDHPHGAEMRQALNCIPVRGPASVDSSLTPLTGHLQNVRVFPHPFSGLYIQSGEDVRLLMAPDNERPDYVITSAPFEEVGYERLTESHVTWVRDGVEAESFVECIRDH